MTLAFDSGAMTGVSVSFRPTAHPEKAGQYRNHQGTNEWPPGLCSYLLNREQKEQASRLLHNLGENA